MLVTIFVEDAGLLDGGLGIGKDRHAPAAGRYPCPSLQQHGPVEVQLMPGPIAAGEVIPAVAAPSGSWASSAPGLLHHFEEQQVGEFGKRTAGS